MVGPDVTGDAGAPGAPRRPVAPERRPEIYGPLTEPVPALPAPRPEAPPAPLAVGIADEVASGPRGVVEQVRRCVDGGADLVVLGELAGVDDEDLATLGSGDPRPAAAAGSELVELLAGALGEGVHVATSIVDVTRDGPALAGVVVGAGGTALHQPALHRSPRHPWQQVLGDRAKVLATQAGGLAVLAGDDLLVPEAARLAVLGGAHVLACPVQPDPGGWLGALVLARAVESGVDVVASWAGGCASAQGADTVRSVCPPRPRTDRSRT